VSWLSRLFRGSRPGPSAASQAYTGAMDRAGQIAPQIEDRFLERDAAFDPGAAFKEYSAGAFSDFGKQLSYALRDNAYGAVGSGRMDTGFYDQDRGYIANELSRSYLADINRAALETTGMRQRQNEYLGQYGLNRTQDYQDLVAGQLDRETAERNARRRYKADLIGSGVRLAGALTPRTGGMR